MIRSRSNFLDRWSARTILRSWDCGLHRGAFSCADEDSKPGGNNVAVVSYSLWANKFGSDPNVVGRTLTLNATPYTVIGVAPHGFKGTFTFGNAEQVWVPVSMYPRILSGFVKDNFNDRRFLTTTVIGRLKRRR